MSSRALTGLVTMCLAVVPSIAAACSCAPATREEILAGAEVAFQGRVEAVTPSEDGTRDVVSVRVTKPFHGIVAREIIVTTSRIPGLCGYPMEVGKSYDFAGKHDPATDTLGVNMCAMVPLNPRKF